MKYLISLFLLFGVMAIKPISIKTEGHNRLGDRSDLELRIMALDQDAVILKWTSRNDASVLGYEVEKLTTGDRFETIGFAPAQSRGASVNFRYIDRPVKPGDLIYRIREIQSNEKSLLSSEFLYSFAAPSEIFSIQSVTMKISEVVVELSTSREADVEIRLMKQSGEIIAKYFSQNVHAEKSRIVLKTEKNLLPGEKYFIEVRSESRKQLLEAVF